MNNLQPITECHSHILNFQFILHLRLSNLYSHIDKNVNILVAVVNATQQLTSHIYVILSIFGSTTHILTHLPSIVSFNVIKRNAIHHKSMIHSMSLYVNVSHHPIPVRSLLTRLKKNNRIVAKQRMVRSLLKFQTIKKNYFNSTNMSIRWKQREQPFFKEAVKQKTNDLKSIIEVNKKKGLISF